MISIQFFVVSFLFISIRFISFHFASFFLGLLVLFFLWFNHHHRHLKEARACKHTKHSHALTAQLTVSSAIMNMYIIKICHTERRANRCKENLDVQRKNERTLSAFESKYCVYRVERSVYNVCVRTTTNA